jgi:hypothetical protein
MEEIAAMISQGRKGKRKPLVTITKNQWLKKRVIV